MEKPLSTLADPYDAIAELYDLEHEDFTTDRDLWLNFATAIGDPILEMGCGTGRLSIPLAQAGFDVTGLDRSGPMLDRARSAASRAGVDDRLTWFKAGMESADRAPGGPFGIVLFSLNALMHLPDSASQRAALASAFRALDPRGQLVIDTMNPSPESLVALDSTTHHEGSWMLANGTSIDKWSWRKVRPHRQVIETLLWYDQVSPNGELRRYRSEFEFRYVSPNELLLMLEAAGFSEFHVYGNYDLESFSEDSERLIVTAEVTPSSTPGR